MKRFGFLIFVCWVLTSCGGFFSDPSYGSPRLSLDEAWRKASSYRYIPDGDDAMDSWKCPTKFEEDGGGDCEDFAIYMMWLLGPDSGAELVQGIIEDSNGWTGRGHAFVHYDGQYYEPQNYNVYVDIDFYDRIVYDSWGWTMWQAFFMAE